jgi:hypothetical protein
MSGFEIIGVISSITQLLDFGLKLTSLVTEVYSRVKEAPERIAIHTAQIRRLVDTARLIERSSELQKPIVDIHLTAILTEAKGLQCILERTVADYSKGSRKKRAWNALVGGEEKRILNGFDRLEKEKSALILCINLIHTESLGSICSKVGELNPKMDMIGQGVAALKKNFGDAKTQPSRPVSCGVPVQQLNVFQYQTLLTTISFPMKNREPIRTRQLGSGRMGQEFAEQAHPVYSHYLLNAVSLTTSGISD